MKAVRVSLMTLVLLVGATPRAVPTADQPTQNSTQTITAAAGDCYLINGMWVCEP